MPLKIVYLDDESAICEMFADNFTTPEVSIETFTDPEAAVYAINKSTPDLVFLDYRLPNTTGEDIALRLKPSVPKVLITGDLFVTKTSCFVKIFTKPFNFTEIDFFIQGYLKHKKKIS